MVREVDFERLAYLRSVFGSPPVLRVVDLSRQLAELENRASSWTDLLGGEDTCYIELVRVFQFGGGAVVLFNQFVEYPDSLVVTISRFVHVVAGEIVTSLDLNYT